MSKGLSLIAACIAATAVAADAQDAVRIQPDSYSVRVDNPKVRVLEYTGRPGMGVCGAGMHSHPDHLTILLSPAHVRVRAGGKVRMVDLPSGAVFWEPAVTHETENVGKEPVRSLIVEVKPVPAR